MGHICVSNVIACASFVASGTLNYINVL
jgi:hypothetical protein